MRRVVVIGAGAAGTTAAIFAAEAGAETLLVERTRDGGRKILISGGGRCNVLPARLDESRFITDSSPNTLRKIVRAWPLDEQIAFFEREVGVPLVEETESAKLFPASHRARDVRDGLLALAQRRGARLLTEARVVDLAPSGTGWAVALDGAPPLAADAVIVATGGLSVPNTGSDGTGLRILERLGHTLHPTYAALTPVTADAGPFAELAGISLRVALTARTDGRAATASGGFLFTHRGYSGPSVLDVSHVVVRSRAEAAVPAARLTVRWTPHDEAAWESLLRPQGGRVVASVVRTGRATSVGGWSRRWCAASCRGRATRATRRPRSPAAACGSPTSIPARSRAGATRGCICAARCWTRSGRSAATTSCGPGRPGVRPAAARRWRRPDVRPTRRSGF